MTILCETKELLARLVAFDTTSAKSNLPLIDYVRDYLAGLGVEATLVPSEDGEKACLFASIGPAEGGGVGLSGHSDCVPVDGQSWTSDPFTLAERDGKLYARGSCDMKGFIACVLASVPLFQEAALKEPIHIIISYDEEVGCIGVRPLVAELGSRLPKPHLVIVGEPTSMEVIDAHKGIDAYRTTVTGREAHSSMPQLGVSAISAAAELIGEIDRLGADLATRQTDPRFDPPYSTVQVGTIAGGTAPNIVPKHCTFAWQIRTLPETNPDEVPNRLSKFAAATLLPRMQRVAAGATIETEQRNAAPAFQAAAASEAVALALALTGSTERKAVSYATEAAFFERAGCQSVICGPGNIAQAHAADEYVSVEQIETCLGFLAKLSDRLSA